MKLKDKFLGLGVVEDTKYLDLYCEIVQKNIGRGAEKNKTQLHHILPRFYYTDNNLEVDETALNKVNLLHREHLLAHYYLYMCGIGSFKWKNLSSVGMLLGNFKYMSPMTEEYLEEYQRIREEYLEKQSIVCGDRFRGRKQSEEVIQNRVKKNTGKKRTEETKKKMSAWQKGKPKSESAKRNMKEAQRKYFDSLSEEEKEKRRNRLKNFCANRTEEDKKILSEKLSRALKGRVVSDEERKHHSESLKGKPKSDSHRLNLARSRSKIAFVVNGEVFLSWKEVHEFLLSIGIDVYREKFIQMVDNGKIISEKVYSAHYYRK